jgi:hypothetical protein
MIGRSVGRWSLWVATVGRRAEVTRRDLDVLTFAAEMFGAPMLLVAELLGAARAGPPAGGADRAARRVAAKLETLGYARRVRAVGQTWLVPTSRGLALAQHPDHERPYDPWRPAAWKLSHVETVARLRLYLEREHPGAWWESERAIRRRWRGSGASVRITDGGLHLPDGTAVGVEVELHVKPPGLYVTAVADRDRAWSRIWWFTPAGHVGLLRRRLEDAKARDHEVRQLPEGVSR